MRTTPRLASLKTEAIALSDGCKYLDDVSVQRALTADETKLYDDAITRMQAIPAEVDAEIKRTETIDNIATVTAGIADAAAPVAPAAPVHGDLARTESRFFTYDPSKAGQPFSPAVSVEETGEFALSIARARFHKSTPDEANEVLGRFGMQMGEDLRVRAVAHGVAADGTAPVTIEGDLIKFVDANRYAVNRSRRLPMPDNHAPTFKRPRVTQRTLVAKQANENDVLASQRMQLAGDTVTKETHGGVLSLSEQEIDWTDPAMLGLAIQDLAESYAIDTDDSLCTAIETALTASTHTILSLTATAAQVTPAIAASAAAVYSTSKRMADVIFAAVDRWAFLAGLTDTTGRPVFPVAGAMNAPGSNSGVATFSGLNVMGLDVIVDPNFTAGTFGTAATSLIETYEQNKGLLSINSPSTLEVQYAYRGYWAVNVYGAGVNALAAT